MVRERLVGVESVCAGERAVKGRWQGQGPPCSGLLHTTVPSAARPDAQPFTVCSLCEASLWLSLSGRWSEVSRKVPSRDMVEKQRALLTKGLYVVSTMG